ncbi:hypothetical protein C0J52_00019 [Blattella germanica]|nr:hypothetical protein C0J52_00019 [Blattella germanica]
MKLLLLISGFLVAVILLQADNVSCQSGAITPLWPCYSVFKASLGMNATTMTTYYRYTSRFVHSEGDVYDPNNPDCAFTFEGPPNSRIQLQLFNVVIQSPGYVSTSLHASGNCSAGAVRIYNFTTTGALVQANEVCNSFQTGVLLQSDTNVAVVTHTVARGHFDLQVTMIPFNNTFRSGSLVRSLPARKENVILLGHTDSEIHLLSNLINPPHRSNNSQEDNSNDYYDEYADTNGNEILGRPVVNQNVRRKGTNKIKNQQKFPIQESDPVNRHELNDLRNQLARQDEILNLLTSNKFSALKNELNKPSKDQSTDRFAQQQQSPDNVSPPNNIQASSVLSQMQQDQLNQLLTTIPVRNQDKGPLALPLISQADRLSAPNRVAQNQPESFLTMLQQLNSQNKMNSVTVTDEQQIIDSIKSKLQMQQMDENIQKQKVALQDQNEQLKQLVQQLVQAASNLVPQTTKPSQTTMSDLLTQLAQTVMPQNMEEISKEESNPSMPNADPSSSDDVPQIHNLMHLIRNQEIEQNVNSREVENRLGSVKESAQLSPETDKTTSEQMSHLDDHNQKTPMNINKIGSSQTVHRENSKFSDKILIPQPLKTITEHDTSSKNISEPTKAVPRNIPFLEDSK